MGLANLKKQSGFLAHPIVSHFIKLVYERHRVRSTELPLVILGLMTAVMLITYELSSVAAFTVAQGMMKVNGATAYKHNGYYRHHTQR